MVMVLTEKH